MTSGWRRVAAGVAVVAAVGFGGEAPAGAAPVTDPCILTLSEAREVGGAETDQAGADRNTCTYRNARSEPRLTLQVLANAGVEREERLRDLEDASRYTRRKQGRALTWIANDALVGWVLEGETFVEVRVEGRSFDTKAKRALERALFRITEHLH